MSHFDADYWNKRYENAETRWDMGTVSPPLQTYFDQLTDKNIAILIPGCGNAYEAHYLLNKGFTNITLIDISDKLIDKLKKQLGPLYEKEVKIVHEDFFEFKGLFDLIVEQTFFCALDPDQREAYVHKTHELLKPGGKLMGVLFDCDFGEKKEPPFGGNKGEYTALFAPLFHIKTMEACYNSIPPRAGHELFMILKTRGIRMYRKSLNCTNQLIYIYCCWVSSCILCYSPYR